MNEWINNTSETGLEQNHTGDSELRFSALARLHCRDESNRMLRGEELGFKSHS